MKEQNSFKKNTVLLLVGTFFNKGIQFLVIPFFSSWLTTEEYGTFDLLYTYIALFIPIITLSTQEAVFRLSVDETGLEHKKANITNGLFIDLFNFIIVVCVLGFLFGTDSKTLFACFVLYLFAEMFSVYLRGFLRAIKRLDIYSFAMALSTIFMAVLVTVFVLGLDWGLEGIVLGYGLGTLLGDIVVCIWSSWIRMLQINMFSWGRIKELIGYSISLVPNDLSWWIMNASDRQIINYFFGATANGIYAITHKVPALCSVIFNMFSVSWQQEVVSRIDDDDRNEYVNKVLEKLVVVLFTICSGLLAGSFLLYYYIFDIKYFDAINYSPVLILAAIFMALSQFLGGIQIALKRPKQNGVTTIIGAFFNIVIHLCLIGMIGLYAACISTLIANAIIMVLRIILLKDTFSIRMTPKSVCAVVGFGYFFVMSYIHQNALLNWTNVLLSLVFFVLMNKGMIMDFFPKRIKAKMRR